MWSTRRMATISFEIPDLPEGHDQAVIAIVARRADPANPDGSPDPDLAGLLNNPASPLVTTIQSELQALGFDTALSFMGVPSLTDVEAGGFAAIDDVVALGSNPPE